MSLPTINIPTAPLSTGAVPFQLLETYDSITKNGCYEVDLPYL